MELSDLQTQIPNMSDKELTELILSIRMARRGRTKAEPIIKPVKEKKVKAVKTPALDLSTIDMATLTPEQAIEILKTLGLA